MLRRFFLGRVSRLRATERLAIAISLASALGRSNPLDRAVLDELIEPLKTYATLRWINRGCHRSASVLIMVMVLWRFEKHRIERIA